MPENRQVSTQPSEPDEAPLQGAARLPHGYHLDPHSHTQGQIVYAAAGALATATERGTSVAPANRVTWTPPQFTHSHRFYGETDVRLLAVPLDLCGGLVEHPSVFRGESPPGRGAPRTHRQAGEAARRAQTTAHRDRRRTCRCRRESLHLPEASDDRLRAATALLHEDPARLATLAELGRSVGASDCTLSRLFHAELGMSFHRWRTTLRIHHALAHLTDGMSVTDTAMACGWSNPSSFIDAFTEIIGQTPGRYQADLRNDRT
jgi:AraC-like DNA-binding protein